MTFQELYYRDPYQTEFDAQVLSCLELDGRCALQLSQSCFYPEGGGQPADTGWLYPNRPQCRLDEEAQSFTSEADPASADAVRILDVQESEGGAIHYTDKPLSVGASVHGVIDFKRRFSFMQGHTAEHILSGLIHARFGYENVGFHMHEVITLDVDGPLDEAAIEALELDVNRVIWENLSVELLYPDADELSSIPYRSKKELTDPVRIVHIEDADDCACCGLHVRRTGEIGLMKILSFVPHRGGTRITMLAGSDALDDYRYKHSQNQEIVSMLSAKPDETADAVRRALAESAEKDKRIAAINQAYFEARAEQMGGSEEALAFANEPLLNNLEIRLFCDLLLEKGAAKICAVLTANENGGYFYCIGSDVIDLRAAAKELNSALAGRGGGKARMIQGSFKADEETIRAKLMELVRSTLPDPE